MERHASETDVLSLSSLLAESANTEKFATWVTLALVACAHCLTFLQELPKVAIAVMIVTGAFLECSAYQVQLMEVIVGLANK